MVRTKIFKSNRSQALRLPKPVALPDEVREVDIAVVGRSRVITPAGSSWLTFFQEGPRVSDDYLGSRLQPEPQRREPL
jgi:antitoxin VapB